MKNENNDKRTDHFEFSSRPPRPNDVVDDLLDRISEVLDRWEEQNRDAHLCYDMIAAWASLQRVASDLIPDEDTGLVDKINEIVSSHSEQLINQALLVPNPSVWLDEAKEFAHLDENLEIEDPLERASRARLLLSDLDDADLVLYASVVFDKEDDKLSKELGRCHLWMRENRPAFLSARAFAKVVIDSVRSDLEDDPELSLTLYKFRAIITEAEAASAELSFEGQQKLPAESIQELIRNRIADKDTRMVKKEPRKSIIRRKVKDLKGRLRGIEPYIPHVWYPPGAGVPVTAADTPTEEHKFIMDEGDIRITCSWRAEQDDSPAYIVLSWRNNTVVQHELWAWFIDPEAEEVISEIRLGTDPVGEQYISRDALGFDPTRKKWGLSIILKEMKP